MNNFRSGYVSLTGRPNVGKSTLLNTILGEKIAIVTAKPQTTRNRIIGIKTVPGAQIIFTDTPGIHKPKHKLGEAMVKGALESVREADVVLFMVEPQEPGPGDRHILEILKGLQKPVFLLINKIDRVKKPQLLPLIDSYSGLFRFREIVPVSALTGDGVTVLLKRIIEFLPEGPPYYPEDLLTDQQERDLVSEIIREKIMEQTEEEIPYSVAVEVTDWSQREDGLVALRANIYVEREGQKGIIIGKGGLRLKDIGTAARLGIEGLLGRRVFLELWVKIKRDWRSNELSLKDLGYR